MLKRLIAHQIVKEKKQKGAALTLRKTVLPTTSNVADLLINQLNESFKIRNPFAGLFRTKDNTPKETTETPKETAEAPKKTTESAFRQSLLAYLMVDSDDAFVDFTTTVAGILSAEIGGQPLATGGYVVFAEYQASKDNYLLTALLTTQATPSFDEHLNLITTNPLDFEHLRHGARIRLKAVKSNREGVVQFISQSAEGVSDYFVEFLGCLPVLRPAAQGVKRLGGRSKKASFVPRRKLAV
jgi:nucleoid-associated protein YejK